MGFTVDAKHVILCGLVTLFLTWAAFHDKIPHGDSVSVQGRKDLSDASPLTETSPFLGDDSDATEDGTVENVEAEGVSGESEEDAAQTEENAEFSQEDSEEPEEQSVREMEETAVVTPKPEYNANPFLAQIKQNNLEAANKEDAIQSCIAENGCGTP